MRSSVAAIIGHTLGACALALSACEQAPNPDATPSTPSTLTINKADYAERLHGFWLGQSIGNWTGLVTEMDKIGGEGPHGVFYTRADWGGPDQPAIWGEGQPSDISPTIDFVLRRPGEVWGADDDTDIEYLYQEALFQTGASILTGEQIRAAWLAHVYDEQSATPYGRDGEVWQNYLWVSNQRAHELMLAGVVPPQTGDPAQNPHTDMIDAQLTTEIFGLFAPGHPDVAREIGRLPVQTTARGAAEEAATFYITMHALAPLVDAESPLSEQVRAMAVAARAGLSDGGYPAAMFDYVAAAHADGQSWEAARDGLYERYQVRGEDGYDITGRGLYCNGCFASGINFGASLISLFYGEGDIRETIRIAVLAGWDSDNPAATWGGLLGFIIGREGVEQAFGGPLSDQFNIHRTRRGFPNDGMDSFPAMAERGVAVTERVILDRLGGRVGEDGRAWEIPLRDSAIESAARAE